ncbi:MAG: hypothetical protein ACFBSG_11395 [Leptolyngbyaceae cyanobacterium]
MNEVRVPFLEYPTAIINSYLNYVMTDHGSRKQRSPDDEQKLLFALTGIGGLIEYNVRAGYQQFARRNNLLNDSYERYSDLLDSLNQYIISESLRLLLKKSSQIRNKLVHSDFPALYRHTKQAYEIKDSGLYQASFEPIVHMISTKITRYGCNVDIQTGLAYDERGAPVPCKKLIPGEGGGIVCDFNYFYESGHFIHVYDVLITTYRSACFFLYENMNP